MGLVLFPVKFQENESQFLCQHNSYQNSLIKNTTSSVKTSSFIVAVVIKSKEFAAGFDYSVLIEPVKKFEMFVQYTFFYISQCFFNFAKM